MNFSSAERQRVIDYKNYKDKPAITNTALIAIVGKDDKSPERTKFLATYWRVVHVVEDSARAIAKDTADADELLHASAGTFGRNILEHPEPMHDKAMYERLYCDLIERGTPDPNMEVFRRRSQEYTSKLPE